MGDATDHWAAASGLPPIDSLNMWPMISGANLTSPRDDVGILVNRDMFVQGRWKYVRGGTRMIESERGGPIYPNASTAEDPIDSHKYKCPPEGCLFDVVAELAEENEVSSEHPDVVARMQKELELQAKTIWETDHFESPQCKQTAFNLYGGFYGPWLEVDYREMDYVVNVV